MKRFILYISLCVILPLALLGCAKNEAAREPLLHQIYSLNVIL